ncbi:hypothetical protein [Pandoraea anhela]|uniref:Uncharacterized protein n=1 Tax=Pandoraea anhela TaxID=2508295 RepID=A0A5E4Z7W2_9BURK|nr:hypothetical protein [Pandoraea anhela]VVE56762.1 hypothetical protein PAN31108_05134 [Pandoraea anhela]
MAATEILPNEASQPPDHLEPEALLQLASDIRTFLTQTRIGGIGVHATTAREFSTPYISGYPTDFAAMSCPRSFYPTVIANRKALDLNAPDLQPVEKVTIDMDDLGLDELGIDPPVPEAYPSVAPHTREIVPKLYQALLGEEAVFQTDGKWNIATPSGVIEMQSRLQIDNLMVVVFCTETTTFVYFAQDVDPHRASAPQLHIDRRVGSGDTVRLGELTIVNARRRYSRLYPEAAGRSAFARAPETAHTLAPATKSAEEVIAAAIRRDIENSKICTRLHVNRLVDVENSSANFLLPLRAITDRAIDFVFLRDSGVRVANSPLSPIRGLQALAVVTNELRDKLMLGQSASLKLISRKLLEPEIVTTLAKGIQFLNSDTKTTAALFRKTTTNYLRLLAVLMSDGVVEQLAVWNMLKSREGQHLTSMLGREAGYDLPLGRAMMGLLDEFSDQHALLSSIRSTLITSKTSRRDGFLRELNRHLKRGAPYAAILKIELESKQYACPTASLNASANYFESIHNHDFQLRDKLTRKDRMRHAVQHEALGSILDTLRMDLSTEAFIAMATNNLGAELLRDMPTIPLSEQRSYRGLVFSAVENAWQKVLPSDSPPSRVMQSVLSKVGPQIGREIAAARKPRRDHIVENARDNFAKFLRDHPDATQNEVVSKRLQIRRDAMAEYTGLIRSNGKTLDRSAQSLIAHGSEDASNNAAMLKHQRHVAAATAAAAMTVTTHAGQTGRREAEDCALPTSQASTLRDAAFQAQAIREAGQREAIRRAFSSPPAIALTVAAFGTQATHDASRREAIDHAFQASQEMARREAASRNQAALNKAGIFWRIASDTSNTLRNAEKAIKSVASRHQQKPSREPRTQQGSALSRSRLPRAASTNSLSSLCSVTSAEVDAVLNEVLGPGFDAIPTLPDVPDCPVGGGHPAQRSSEGWGPSAFK